MRARAASPFPEPFMQYKETQMNTRGFSLVREESFPKFPAPSNCGGTTPPERNCSP